MIKMRSIFFTLIILFLTKCCFSQESDLENSTHKFFYEGDSINLKQIISMVKVQSPYLIPEKEDVCELRIRDIGVCEKLNIHVIQLNMSIGISCRGVFRTIFLKSGEYLGYYDSDIAEPKNLNNEILIWEFESGETVNMDLSNGVPKEFKFAGFVRELTK